MQTAIPFMQLRGGSSKGLYFHAADLPADQETRDNLFALFFSSKGSKGTGFGLFIARNIVAQHGGTISVASTKGRGSIFIIQVPAPDVQGDNRHAPPGRELIVNPNVA